MGKVQVVGNRDLDMAGRCRVHREGRHHHILIKKPEGGELTDPQKKRNKRLRRKRIKVEHTIRRCRLWRITKHVYRNKLRHIGQVWLIVCGLVNLSSS